MIYNTYLNKIKDDFILLFNIFYFKYLNNISKIFIINN